LLLQAENCMTYAICIKSFSQATFDNAILALDVAVSRAALRRQSDYVSRVWVLCTPHFASMMGDLAHAAVSKTNCMNVWGGCVSGILDGTQVLGHHPTILVAVFGKEFETQVGSLHNQAIHLQLCEAEPGNDLALAFVNDEAQGALVKADTLGLMSYGANYTKMPRLEHGRLQPDPVCSTQMDVHQPMVLNSEGLSFYTKPLRVSESNGLFLVGVDNQPAALALGCPPEQTHPVGLRLQVLHGQGESWIPVMNIHADGTLSLAAPVMKGQQVRLAHRTAKAIEKDIEQWVPAVRDHFTQGDPELGLMFAGFERSHMCHDDEDDIAAVLNAFPDTRWIGIFGQAAWLADDQTLVAAPRNNRLCMCLFNPPYVPYIP
jgi:hypothetical protein